MTATRGAVAAVTGAASGIGRSLALELAARGADLALADRDEAGLASVAAEIGGKRKITTHRVDVGDPADITAFAQAAIAAHPALNILINNAGVALMGAFGEIDQPQMEWLMNINFWGTVHATRAFLPHLADREDGEQEMTSLQLTPLSFRGDATASNPESRGSPMRNCALGFTPSGRPGTTATSHPPVS